MRKQNKERKKTRKIINKQLNIETILQNFSCCVYLSTVRGTFLSTQGIGELDSSLQMVE